LAKGILAGLVEGDGDKYVRLLLYCRQNGVLCILEDGLRLLDDHHRFTTQSLGLVEKGSGYVERIAPEIGRDHIFLPLEMEHTYYLLSDIPAGETELASAFRDGKPLPHYNYPDYPAGSLRTTIRDFSRFVAFYLEPAAQETAILQPEPIEVMFGQYGEYTNMGEDQMGLLWVHMDWTFFESIGHTGADPGVNAFLFLSPDKNYATILAMNGNPDNYLIMRATLERLWQEGQRLTSGH
jgi:CubicO group peptidase (beta-lactamase class C family)